jgi:hypothetical protein
VADLVEAEVDLEAVAEAVAASVALVVEALEAVEQVGTGKE